MAFLRECPSTKSRSPYLRRGCCGGAKLKRTRLKPNNELFDSGLNRSLRCVTEKLAGFGNVRIGDLHVSGLKRHVLKVGLMARSLLNQPDKFGERYAK